MFPRFTHNVKKGLTLIELLVVIVIISVIVAISFRAFVNFKKNNIILTEAAAIKASLEQARSFTLSSKNNEQYGVYFETSRFTIFNGSLYSGLNASNIVENLPSSVQISAIALSGGVHYVLFDRLTGKTSQDGHITLTLTDDSTATKTISIFKTGMAQSN